MDPSDASSAVPPSFGDAEFVLCDLDGVVWLRHRAIEGAAEAIADLRAAGRRVLFVTNNSMSTIAEHEAALAAIGVPATGDVVTSAQAAASLVAPGERVRVAGGRGVVEAVTARDAVAVTYDVDEGASDVDVVVVGLHQDFDYWRMQAANRAIRRGARFIGTNDDATLPTPDGPIPGAGSILAAIATAAGASPTLAGKPHRPMADLVAERCGPRFHPATTIMIGDRHSTDGLFAATIGCRFALVRTGVTQPGEDIDGTVDLDLADLSAVAAVLLETGVRPRGRD